MNRRRVVTVEPDVAIGGSIVGANRSKLVSGNIPRIEWCLRTRHPASTARLSAGSTARRSEAIRVGGMPDQFPCSIKRRAAKRAQLYGGATPKSETKAGRYNAMRPPLRFSKTPANIRRHPPQRGEHNAEVLAEIGEEE